MVKWSSCARMVFLLHKQALWAAQISFVYGNAGGGKGCFMQKKGTIQPADNGLFPVHKKKKLSVLTDGLVRMV